MKWKIGLNTDVWAHFLKFYFNKSQIALRHSKINFKIIALMEVKDISMVALWPTARVGEFSATKPSLKSFYSAVVGSHEHVLAIQETKKRHM